MLPLCAVRQGSANMQTRGRGEESSAPNRNHKTHHGPSLPNPSSALMNGTPRSTGFPHPAQTKQPLWYPFPWTITCSPWSGRRHAPQRFPNCVFGAAGVDCSRLSCEAERSPAAPGGAGGADLVRSRVEPLRGCG